MFFKVSDGLKNDEVKFKIIPKTNEEFISVTYGCIKFIDSYRFLCSSLVKLVKILDSNAFVTWKKEFPDKWHNLNNKLAYPFEYFNGIDDYKKPVDNLKKENFFHSLKSKCPGDDEIAQTKQIIKIFDIKYGEESNKF